MEKHPKAPANNKRLYGQNAAVALKYNPDINYPPVVWLPDLANWLRG